MKLAQDKKREAETNFEKALAVSPKHLRSLDSLIMLATDAKEWSRVATFRKKRADVLDDDDEKAAELCRLADVLEQECGDPQKAVGDARGLGRGARGRHRRAHAARAPATRASASGRS